MALLECYECNGKVSSEADSCPHCGAPVKKDYDDVVCPSCHAKNSAIRMTAERKFISALLFGFLAKGHFNKTFKCITCGFTW